MKEVIHNYGADNNLNGIASIPENINKKAAVLLFNAGVLHKVSAFDINIAFKKTLSDEGALVFRFDLSGMGDSLKASQNLTLEEQIMCDLSQTMDMLEDKYNIHEFIVIGLCTGADNAHKISALDQRVMGVVWLDGYAYPTAEFKKLNTARHLKAAMKPDKLFRFIKRKIFKPNDVVSNAEDNYVWKLPDKEKYRAEMKKIFERGCKSLYFYSGGVNDYYLYENQFYDSFKGEDFLTSIDVEYNCDADHLYVIKRHRFAMLLRLTAWVEKHFSIT